MTRRAAPTALRLHQGWVPPRNHTKHVLPSIPPPTFQPSSASARLRDTTATEAAARCCDPYSSCHTHRHFPTLRIDVGFNSSPSLHTPSPSVHARWRTTSGTTKSATTGTGTPSRGPWDHSSLLGFDADVGSLLKPPEPVAVSPVTHRSGNWAR